MGMSLAFHIAFAAIGIGLPLLLLIAEGISLRTGDPTYRQMARRWGRVAAVLFAVGAVSGTILSFEFGLLWPTWMDFSGAIIGFPFALEGFAFFTEAIFLGLYLYGWERLTPRAHWLCGLVVAISGALSGILVLATNAWMQHPVGFTPWDVLTNPAWPVMAAHSTLATYQAV